MDHHENITVASAIILAESAKNYQIYCVPVWIGIAIVWNIFSEFKALANWFD